MLECVINISEGQNLGAIEVIGRAAGRELLDVHTDPDHHRSVLTVVGEEAARAVAIATVLALDVRRHDGVHPRIGALDVVPFVPLGSASMDDALAARDRFAGWLGSELGVPCFLYGPERALPDIRKGAFSTFSPDTGPPKPHPTAGACAVGARPVLVAYNLWLEKAVLAEARAIAAQMRRPEVRALGLQVGDYVQVSMNLLDPVVVGPADVFDQVSELAEIDRAELVGLIPRSVLDATDPDRWQQLDVAPDRTLEARLADRGMTLVTPPS
ncbi:MAG: glutamate formiminotransferase [Actinobacteria bacterium]|nr:glutamate formiminotransferase [Actinomycetota bacterium]